MVGLPLTWLTAAIAALLLVEVRLECSLAGLICAPGAEDSFPSHLAG